MKYQVTIKMYKEDNGMDSSNQSDIVLFDMCRLFCDEEPISFESINTSRGELDFREVIIPRFASGNKFVIKLSDNDFTFSDKIEMWRRTVEEYRKLGYCCPAILHDKTGKYPTVSYKGHKCIAYAEEYSLGTKVPGRNLQRCPYTYNMLKRA